ncbi:MAG: aminofutalosine synthase MqnE [Acidobacteriaceae bacterium]|jgi:aminodeoxyfutalosine synthase
MSSLSTAAETRTAGAEQRARHGFETSDARLRAIAARVEAGERLGFDDGVALYRSPDILAVGWMANAVRERMHGDIAYFNVNRHINPTNVCVASCRLCAFGRKKGAAGTYTMALEEAWATAGTGLTEAVTEFHIVGGLDPDLPFEYFEELVRGLKERYPKVHVKAFTMVEVAFFAKLYKMTIEETLLRLKAAGVDSLPGGGAEIFADRVRHIICDHKIDGGEWLETARTAHRIGLRSNATMLYGHVENDEDRVDHMLRLRELQDETGGFQTFIPLAFHPDNTALAHIAKTTGMMDLRQIAAGRLLLDNFAHVKSYWQMVSPEMAQISLRFGADDIDGTVIEEKIYHDAGATTPQGMRRADLVRLITEAGRVPFERDTLYRAVTRSEDTFTVAV